MSKSFDLEKDLFWNMDNKLRIKLMGSPAAFKIFVVCVWEYMSTYDLLNNRKLYESYGINHHSLRTHADLVNEALDEYFKN